MLRYWDTCIRSGHSPLCYHCGYVTVLQIEYVKSNPKFSTTMLALFVLALVSDVALEKRFSVPSITFSCFELFACRLLWLASLLSRFSSGIVATLSPWKRRPSLWLWSLASFCTWCPPFHACSSGMGFVCCYWSLLPSPCRLLRMLSKVWHYRNWAVHNLLLIFWIIIWN